MQYFHLNKFAQIDNFLRQRGYSEALVSTVLAKPKNLHKVIGQIINDNPNLSEQELIDRIEKLQPTETVQIKETKPQKYNPQATYPVEQEMADRFQESKEYSSWVIRALKKLRNEAWSKYPDSANTNQLHTEHFLTQWAIHVRNNYGNAFSQIYDWYRDSYLPAKRALAADSSATTIATIPATYGLTNPYAQLKNLSYEDALVLSNNYHSWQSGRFKGLFYTDEKPEDTVYGPKWKNEKYNGWTIKKVTSENNLQTEGSKMQHCVGGYCERVERGNTRIYSLRDPRNEPHVTMEVTGNWNFEQVKGKSNSEPKPEYKLAIGEWLKTLPSFNLADEEYYEDDIDYDSLDEDIDKRFVHKLNAYGIENKAKYANVNEIYDQISDAFLNYNSRRRYRQDGGPKMHDAADSFAQGIISNYKNFDYYELNDRSRIQYLHQQRSLQVRPYGHIKRMPELAKFIEHYSYWRGIFAETLQRKTQRYLTQNMNVDFMRIEELDAAYESFVATYKDVTAKKIDTIPVGDPIRLKLYNMLSKLFDYAKTEPKYYKENLDTMPKDESIRIMTQTIEALCSISKFFDIQQTNNQKLDEDAFGYFEPNTSPPDPDDYETDLEYEQAQEKYQKQLDDEQAEYVAEIRSQNTPYCFDDAVEKELERLLPYSNLKVPDWIVEYYKENNASLPWSLQFIQMHTKQANGWYQRIKF